MADKVDAQAVAPEALFAHAVFKCETCQQFCEFDLGTVNKLVGGVPVSCSYCKRRVQASQYDRDVLAFIVSRIAVNENTVPLLGVAGWTAIMFVMLFVSVLIAFVMLFAGVVCALICNRTVPVSQEVIVLRLCDEGSI